MAEGSQPIVRPPRNEAPDFDEPPTLVDGEVPF